MSGKLTTINGYDTYEVVSAIQKSIRRGKEYDAMYWAIELIESGFYNWLKTRLRVIAHEDIGIGDKIAFLFAVQSLNDLETMYKAKKGEWRLALANVILSLCRARKSRESDNFQCVVWGERKFGKKLNIPEYAVDKHTLKGKMLKRGELHAAKESYKLIPPNPDDPYFEQATKIWLKCEEEKTNIYYEKPIDRGDPNQEKTDEGQRRLIDANKENEDK